MNINKALLSVFVFLASAGYVAYQALGGGTASAALATSQSGQSSTTVTQTPSTTDQAGQIQVVPSTTPQQVVAVTQTPSKTTTTPPPTPVSTPSPTPVATPTPVPVTKPKGQYADGSYTGSSADAYYGTVQVQAIISGGKITNVTFLQYPSDRRTSQTINARAMKLLTTEAIAAQSANVNVVSGATDTTQAFVQSLSSALAQAKNS